MESVENARFGLDIAGIGGDFKIGIHGNSIGVNLGAEQLNIECIDP